MSDREKCRYCRKPLATAEDVDASSDTLGLCWSIVDYCDVSAEEAIDRRDAEIAELERELAQIKAVLADPLAVHLNMMRGTIKWTRSNLWHLLGCQEGMSYKDTPDLSRMIRHVEENPTVIPHVP